MTVKAKFGVSFDIGYRAFASCFYRETREGLHVLDWRCMDFHTSPKEKSFPNKFISYLVFLFGNFEQLGACCRLHVALIERQMRKNRKACKVQQQLSSFLANLGPKGAGVVGLQLVIERVKIVHANLKKAWYTDAIKKTLRRGSKGKKSRKEAAVTSIEPFFSSSLSSTWHERKRHRFDLADSLAQALGFVRAQRKRAALQAARRLKLTRKMAPLAAAPTSTNTQNQRVSTRTKSEPPPDGRVARKRRAASLDVRRKTKRLKIFT